MSGGVCLVGDADAVGVAPRVHEAELVPAGPPRRPPPLATPPPAARPLAHGRPHSAADIWLGAAVGRSAEPGPATSVTAGATSRR